MNQPYALSGPERQGIDIAIRIRGVCIGAIAKNGAVRFRCSHDLALTGSFTRRGSSSTFPIKTVLLRNTRWGAFAQPMSNNKRYSLPSLLESRKR
jgi:hypothetical protein